MVRVPVTLACLLASAPALADTWSDADTAREVVAVSLLVLDWRQTRTIALNPAQYRETNWHLGDHPSTGRVDAYFLGVIVGHVAIAYNLPRPYREALQYVTIGIQAAAVSNNYRLGVKLDF